MKKLLLLLLFFPVATMAIEINPGAYRWADGDKKGYERKAVRMIDAGEIKVSPDIPIHTFSVICVDGVKVLTTTKQGAIGSIIIPGSCDGKPVQQKQEQVREVRPIQEVITPSGRKMVDW